MTELELKEIRNNEVSKYQLLEVMIPKWDKTLMILQRAVFITPLLYWRYIRENKKNGESIKSIGEKWMISTVRAKLFQTSQRFILDSFKINVEIPFFKFPHEMVIYWDVNVGMWNVVWIPWAKYEGEIKEAKYLKLSNRALIEYEYFKEGGLIAMSEIWNDDTQEKLQKKYPGKFLNRSIRKDEFETIMYSMNIPERYWGERNNAELGQDKKVIKEVLKYCKGIGDKKTEKLIKARLTNLSSM